LLLSLLTATDTDDDVIEAITNWHGSRSTARTGHGPERCGSPGPFHFDVGISSSHHIARFWGVAGEPADLEEEAAEHASARLVPIQAQAHDISSIAARERAFTER
jgi:hypothetical protein